MDKQNTVLIVIVAAIFLTFAITAAVMMTGDNSSNDTHTPEEAGDTTEFNYSDYDVLKEYVNKLNNCGGHITDSNNNVVEFTIAYHAILKDDLLLITSTDGKELWIYQIHDIREIRVNP